MNNKNLSKIEEIIIKDNLCITQNPKGLTKLWPKSYVSNFYKKAFKEYSCRKEKINLLDIDTTNQNQILLWEKLFFNLNLIQSKSSTFTNPNLNKKKLSNNLFDIIIFSKIPKFNTKQVIKNILNHLNKKGILIIEDCGENSDCILKVFMTYSWKYNISIEDYRLHRILRNNCLLIIKHYESNLFSM